jgi:hypothetical protein
MTSFSSVTACISILRYCRSLWWRAVWNAPSGTRLFCGEQSQITGQQKLSRL